MLISKLKYNKSRLRNVGSSFCWAPQTVLRINSFGVVQNCCHQTNLKKPESLKYLEFWRLNKKSHINQNILNFSIPTECYYCKSYFDQLNFDGVCAKSYDFLAEYSNQYFPVSLELQVDNTCNLTCIMCNHLCSNQFSHPNEYSNKNADSHTQQEILEQLPEIIPHLKYASFMGGEPFLSNFYKNIWDILINKKPDIQISIVTNGTIFNKSVEFYLNHLQFNICVSVDSFRKECFEKIRPGSNYNQVMQNLVQFSEYCQSKGTTFSVAVCPMIDNWEEIPQIIQKCNSEGWPIRFNELTTPWHLSLYSLPVSDLIEVEKYFKNEYKLLVNTQTTILNKQVFKVLINRISYVLKLKIIANKNSEYTNQTNRARQEIIETFMDKSDLSLDSNLLKSRFSVAVNQIPDLYITEQFIDFFKNEDNIRDYYSTFVKDPESFDFYLNIMAGKMI